MVPKLPILHCLFSALSSSSQLYIPHPHQEDMDAKTNAKVTHMFMKALSRKIFPHLNRVSSYCKNTFPDNALVHTV